MAGTEPTGGWSLAAWKSILTAIVLLLILVTVWGGYLTFRLLDAPLETPDQPRHARLRPTARPAGAPSAAAEPDEGEEEEAPVVRTASRRPPAAEPARPASGSNAVLRTEQAPLALHDYLEEQAAILRRELRENAGHTNGLTPTREEIDKLTQEGRVLR